MIDVKTYIIEHNIEQHLHLSRFLDERTFGQMDI